MKNYLDSDMYNHPEEYGFNAVKAALEAHNTGRGQWDCNFTGKHADLEPQGEQGVTLESVDDEYAIAIVHVSKTFTGTDVCLNLPAAAEEDDDTYQQVLDLWMEQAEFVVCGCSVAGEWTGDDWCMHESIEVRVKTVLDVENGTDADATATALIDAAQDAIKGIVSELVLADQIMETLAGWKTYHVDGTSTRHPEGKPCEGSVWSIFQQLNK